MKGTYKTKTRTFNNKNNFVDRLLEVNGYYYSDDLFYYYKKDVRYWHLIDTKTGLSIEKYRTKKGLLEEIQEAIIKLNTYKTSNNKKYTDYVNEYNQMLKESEVL